MNAPPNRKVGHRRTVPANFSIAILIAATLMAFLLSAVPPTNAQTYRGAIRGVVRDPSGAAIVGANVAAKNSDTGLARTTTTVEDGGYVISELPAGTYQVEAESKGFGKFTNNSVSVQVGLETPLDITLSVGTRGESVTVTAVTPILETSQDVLGGVVDQELVAELPLNGRDFGKLVALVPGVTVEGSGVAGTEKGFGQFNINGNRDRSNNYMLDGTDNNDPWFNNSALNQVGITGAPATLLPVDAIQEFNLQSQFPAEYGRSLGGIIEVNTLRDRMSGLHGQAVVSGGSFDTAGAFTELQYGRGHSTVGVSASGAGTAHYLNPVVPQNFTNRGTTGDFALTFARDLTASDHLSLSVRHAFSRYELPNEQIQQAAGQLETADNIETMGIIAYQHIFSPNVLADFRGMVRDTANRLNSNAESTPIMAFSHNDFREGYFNASISVHHGIHEFKAGLDSDNRFLHENFSDVITGDPNDPDYPFDPGTPPTFAFPGNIPSEGARSDLEQAAYVQDLIHYGNWTIAAGLRWDHYQLLANQNAVSPRFSVARYFPSAGLIVHASYDRIFQTPSFENILLSSSQQVVSLDPNVLRLPVEPSHGNYIEVGAAKNFANQLRFDVNYFRRYVNNYADDDQILSTAVSFPIAFRKAILYGAEAKIEVPHWNRFSGFLSYSYIVGNAWFPVTGGLFLGSDANDAISRITGRFWDSQDQRNTVRTRFRYQFTDRFWGGVGGEYGSGLPFEFTGTEQDALAQYSQQVVDRVNFAKGRVRPSLSIDASLGADLWRTEKLQMRIQADVQNINNRLNVIDFGGLFSGNAIGPPRSYALRLTTSF